MRRAILLSTTFFSLTIAAPVCAQSAASQPTADAGAPAAGLQEIIVTAQRRAESAQKAAIAIDVVSSKALANANVTNVANLNAVSPSLNVVLGGGSTASFFVRGVGNFTNNGYSDSAVAFNYDGVYVAKPSAAGTFYDLQRVEVLKGPQGTLYGRNATGGAINVIPEHPVLNKNSLDLTFGYGNYNQIEAEAAMNLAVGSQTAIRISGRIQRHDGYNEDGTSDQDTKAVRFQILTKPSDSVSIRLAADYTFGGGMGPGATYNGTENYAPGAPATSTSPADYVFVPSGLPARSGMLSSRSRSYFAQQVIAGSFTNPAPLVSPYVDDNLWGVHSEVNVDTGIGQLTVIPAFRHSNFNDLFNGPSFHGAVDKEIENQFSLEGRINGKRVGIFDWTLGGYFANDNLTGIVDYDQYVVASVQSYKQNNRSIAGFGRIVAHITDALRLTAAGRYTSDHKHFDALSTSIVNICTNAPPPYGVGCFGGPSIPVGTSVGGIAASIPAGELPFGFPAGPGPANAVPFGAAGNILFLSPTLVDQTLNNKRFTYRLAAEVDVARNSLAYFSYETGYRSGGFSVASGHESYLPESIRAWTIGIKNRFWGNRLQLNVEAFDWIYRNQQISHFGLDELGNESFFTDNAGSSRIRGVDVDLQAKVTGTTLINGSVQYLDSKLTEFLYDVPRGANYLPPAVGCPYSPTTNGQGQTVYTVDCANHPGLNSPKWAINAGVQQTVPLGNYDLTLSGEGRYRANRVDGFDYLPQENSGSDVTFDASISFGPTTGAWSLTAWGTNLTNRLVPGVTQFNSSVANNLSTVYAPPRTYGVRFSAKI